MSNGLNESILRENKVKKISKTKIARVYATALYEAAVEKKCLDKVWKDVAGLNKVFNEDKDVVTYLSNPLWKDEDKSDVLKKIAKILSIDNETLNCLTIAVGNNHAKDLQAIVKEFISVYYQKNDILEVQVETVKDLSADQDNKLQKTLEKLLSKKVAISYKLSPEILGGLRITCGSKLFDDSLSAKLNYLENVMKGK